LLRELAQLEDRPTASKDRYAMALALAAYQAAKTLPRNLHRETR
jgi:hypothetical protein